MAVAHGSGARQAYPEKAWDDMKPLIIRKYIEEGLTLEQTMTALKAEGFMATEKMYKTRIKRWGLTKYIKDDKAIDVLTSSEDGRHRAHTIAGRPITKEEAERHLKRKKRPGTVPQLQTPEPQMNGDVPTMDNVVTGSEFLVSPMDDQYHPMFNENIVFPDPAANWAMDDNFGRRDTLTQNVWSPAVEQEDVDDLEMDMGLTDLATGNTDQSLVPSDQDWYINPRLLGTAGLKWVTEMFLHSMRDFSSLTLKSVLGQEMPPLAEHRFNRLWDLYCTRAAHTQQNRIEQALQVRSQAQFTFEEMLNQGDPWMLLSLCLLLTDNLSNPERVAMSSSFLNDMADWAEHASPNHPISQLVRFLQRSDDAKGATALYLLEGTIRMTLDNLRSIVGAHHDLAVEVARIHSRIMTEAGMHASAVQLLSQDLAVVEDRYGVSSLPNLLRRSSLARCYFMAGEFDKSLFQYKQILADPLIEEPHLADIKYGAMYFMAKISAELNDFELAISQAREAMKFGIEREGPEHYWTENAKQLILKFQASQRSIFRSLQADGEVAPVGVMGYGHTGLEILHHQLYQR